MLQQIFAVDVENVTDGHFDEEYLVLCLDLFDS